MAYIYWTNQLFRKERLLSFGKLFHVMLKTTILCHSQKSQQNAL